MNNSWKSGPCEIQPQVKLPAFVYTFPWEVDWRTLTLSGCEVRVFDRNNSSGIKQVLYVLTATAATVATSKTPHTNRSLSLADSHGSSATQIPSCCSFSTWLQLHHFQKSHQRRGNGQKNDGKGGLERLSKRARPAKSDCDCLCFSYQSFSTKAKPLFRRHIKGITTKMCEIFRSHKLARNRAIPTHRKTFALQCQETVSGTFRKNVFLSVRICLCAECLALSAEFPALPGASQRKKKNLSTLEATLKLESHDGTKSTTPEQDINVYSSYKNKFPKHFFSHHFALT